MILDFVLVAPLILFGLLGFKDGIVRKAAGIGTAIAAMFVAHSFMQDVGQFFVEHLSSSPSSAPLLGFFAIFFSLVLLESLLYRVAGAYRFGGLADRIIGTALGLLQGALIISIVLAMLATQGTPSRRAAQDSRFYTALANLAPQMMDFTTTIWPGALEKLEEGAAPILKRDSTGEQESENVKYIRQTEGKIKSTASPMDSARKMIKR